MAEITRVEIIQTANPHLLTMPGYAVFAGPQDLLPPSDSGEEERFKFPDELDDIFIAGTDLNDRSRELYAKLMGYGNFMAKLVGTTVREIAGDRHPGTYSERIALDSAAFRTMTMDFEGNTYTSAPVGDLRAYSTRDGAVELQVATIDYFSELPYFNGNDEAVFVLDPEAEGAEQLPWLRVRTDLPQNYVTPFSPSWDNAVARLDHVINLAKEQETSFNFN